MNRQFENVAQIIEACRQLVEDQGTRLNNQSGLPAHLQEATQALGKAHAALLRAVAEFRKNG